MSYSYERNFYATVAAPTTLAEKIEIIGTAKNPDNLLTVSMQWFSPSDNKDASLIVNEPSLEDAFEFIEAHRNLTASVAKMPPLPYRVEISGIDKDGKLTNDFSFVITKNEDETLPYRLQMYRDGAPNGEYTQYRSVFDAVYEARELNALEVGEVARVAEYDDGYRQTFYENHEDSLNTALYLSVMEHKNEAGEYEPVPNYRGYDFSPQGVESTIEYHKASIECNRYIDVANVIVELDDATRTLMVQADMIIPSRPDLVTHTATLSFDELVEEDWNRYMDELVGLDNVTDNVATLYEMHKDDFQYSNKNYHRLVDRFIATMTLAATDNTTEKWFELSPLAVNELREHNPSVQAHRGNEEPQKAAKKDYTMEGR